MRSRLLQQFKKSYNMGLKYISWYIIVMMACVPLNYYVEAGVNKIGYKKSTAEGKRKMYNKLKMDLIETTTPTAITSSGTNVSLYDDTNTGSNTLQVIPVEEKIQLEQDFLSTTPMNNIPDMPSSSSSPPTSTSSSTTGTMVPTTEASDTPTTTFISDIVSITPEEDVPCSCGIFLNSQFVKGSQDPPTGEPAISNTIDDTFPCNSIGQKQCQTKCLEKIVQHLPNSANILCASLDRDIHKERAYLFIKNCNNNWYNTNLAAGREYCCKNYKPYKCSIK